ncbi:hypothetical protein H5410_060884 [Solanum commersonii]|uniref:Uncharacterized protein n=1 Tax=Solanum commersonii TaxID=4109 RepID=A0A9J5W7W7_SOLCO|nr:hypothetical protein H5410_060884 [Solanum commersonii]
MAKEDSSSEMELHNEFVEMKEEMSKEYLRRRKLEEIKKGKSIALDPEDQGRSVNVKWRKFIEVAPQKSKLKVSNIVVTQFEKSTMNLNDLFDQDVVVNDESNGVKVASQLVDDDFTTQPPVSSKMKSKHESVPPMKNMNLIDEIKCISDGQKELREDFQVLKQEVHNLKKLMKEFDSKNFNAIEILSKKVDRNNDSKSPYLNSYGSGNNMSGGASSKSIVTGVHPFGSFTMDDDCFKEMGEFREWINEGR